MGTVLTILLKIILYTFCIPLGAIILYLCVFALLVDMKKIYPEKDNLFYRKNAVGVVMFLLWLFRVRIHTTGLQKVPQDTRFLLVGNHRSNFDPMVAWQVFRKHHPAFVAKPSIFKIPLVGPFVRKSCFMPIDRENPRNAIKTINHAAMLLKNQEVSIGIYPEGTRNREDTLLEFHNGVFKIAQKAGAPIVVAALRGTDLIQKNLPFRKTDVYLDVVDVIPAEELKGLKTAELGDRVRSALEEKLAE